MRRLQEWAELQQRPSEVAAMLPAFGEARDLNTLDEVGQTNSRQFLRRDLFAVTAALFLRLKT
jgi:hypothetical protein